MILQLSVANNCLICSKGISNFRNLCVLNLSNNFIDKIEDLFDLKNLTWLNLSGNQIKIIENLDNISLEHLDLSNNCIQILGNLSHLIRLKSLLLHGNLITSFKTEIGYFPVNLLTLSLAENDITDIKQISQLSVLSHLEQLSVMENPCAKSMEIKYRNYILSCCKNLKVLDGTIIQNTANPVEKYHHTISTLNNICYTNPYLSNMSPDTMKAKASSILFPCSSYQKEESIFKKNSLAVSYSTDTPEKISYHSEQEIIIPKDMESVKHAKETVYIDPWKRLESKYEAYDNRPVRPLSKHFYKAISDSSYFSCSTPQPSRKEPVVSNKKKMPQEFVSQAFNCDESSGQEINDKSSLNKVTDGVDEKPFVIKGSVSARKQHKTAVNSVTRNVVKPHEMHILKKDSEFSIRPKYEFNGQLNDKLSANEYTVNESKNISVSSADQPLNKKFLLTRNEKVETFSNHSSTLTSFGTKNLLLSNTIPTTDSAFGSQGSFYDPLCMHRAATQIQALWRGFQCRNLNPMTKHTYMELRCLRAQQHITKLSSELQQQRNICEQKNSLLKQFLEIVQVMWKELHLNKDAKQGNLSHNFLCKSSCKNCASEHISTTFNNQLENLQQTCHVLSIQVKHLHETLHTFMMGNFLCHPGNITDHPELHLKNDGPTLTSLGYWSYVLEDQVDLNINDFEESSPETTADSWPYVSVPDCLTLLPLSGNSVMLSWSPSTIKRIDENISHTLLGYKIYINDHPMAFVSANKNQLIISNLNIYLTYIIYVTTISTLQESNKSQKLVANYCLKNAAKDRNIFHSDACKSISEVNETQNIHSNQSQVVSKQKIIKSDIYSNPTDYCKFSLAFEHKKPIIAEVVEQRIFECSRNISKDNASLIHQQKYKYLKTKSTSLENMVASQVNWSISAKKKQTVCFFSDDEDPVAESNKTGKKKNSRLITLLEKLCSFSTLQNKSESISKYKQLQNLS